MDAEQERHWLVLHQLFGGSNRLLLNLSRLSDDPGTKRELLSRRRDWQHQLADMSHRQQAQLRALDGQILPIASADYPPLLREIPDPPAPLYVLGDVRHLSAPALAVVGSRKSSQAGQRSAGEIVKQGALITEFPLGAPPTRERFPQRNRIISGLCLGVLIVEAAVRSDSLITAHMALEQNREVFALPHSIYHPQGRGCNALLKEGACLVREAGDILAKLRGFSGVVIEPAPSAPVALDPAIQALLALLGDAPVGLDELAASSQQPIAELMRAMTELQLRGLVENKGGLYRRS